MNSDVIALIPARSGSKRIPDKNIKLLNGHPLLAYSIRAAIESGVFDSIVCATDSENYAKIAIKYGAEVPELRPLDISGEKSPDIEWVKWTLDQIKSRGREYEFFSILRPTSPFRLPSTIKNAWDYFKSVPYADSLRAVEKCKEHPGKMWVVRGKNLLPILPFTIDSTPWHSNQYAKLPEIYVQNASLEIARTKMVYERNVIAGENVVPFISSGLEGFDLNNPEDWVLAEYYLENGEAKLPAIPQQM